MAYKYILLKQRIIEKYGSYSFFARTIGATERSVSDKLNRKAQFSQEDIRDWSKALSLSLSEARDYFFS